jgi:hypothetical protein
MSYSHLEIWQSLEATEAGFDPVGKAASSSRSRKRTRGGSSTFIQDPNPASHQSRLVADASVLQRAGHHHLPLRVLAEILLFQHGTESCLAWYVCVIVEANAHGDRGCDSRFPAYILELLVTVQDLFDKNSHLLLRRRLHDPSTHVFLRTH